MLADSDDQRSESHDGKGRSHGEGQRRGKAGTGRRAAQQSGHRAGERRRFSRDDSKRASSQGSRRGTHRDERGADSRDRRNSRRDDTQREDKVVTGPPIPEGFDDKALPFGVRAELRGLSKDRADRVAAHIWAAGVLVDEDPTLAFQHAETARQLAPRLPVVREAAAETAYAAEEYAIALREYRAIRRMSGGDELIPVMADCERALGRPRDALELLTELDTRTTDPAVVIEAVIVESGVRTDLGQRDEALRLLRKVAGQNVGPAFARARLHYALADLLLADGDEVGARASFVTSGELDRQALLDTSDRIAELDGVTLPNQMSDDDEAEQEDAE